MWRRAGFHKDNIIEYHGSLNYLQSSCKKGPVWKINMEQINKIKFNPDTYKVSRVSKSFGVSITPVLFKLLKKNDKGLANKCICFDSGM